MRRHFGFNSNGAKPPGLGKEQVDPSVTKLALTFVHALAHASPRALTVVCCTG